MTTALGIALALAAMWIQISMDEAPGLWPRIRSQQTRDFVGAACMVVMLLGLYLIWRANS